MKPFSMVCAAMIFATTTSFAAAAAAEKAVSSPAAVQVRGPENQSQLLNAVRHLAASRSGKDALTKAIVGGDEGAARRILTENGYTPSAPYRIQFVGSAVKIEWPDSNIVYLTAFQPVHFYNEPTPGWVDRVYIHGKGWYDMATDTYIKSNEW